MRARAAEIQSLEWCSILRPTNQRSERKELIERLLAVMNVAAAQSVSLFQIERRDHLAPQRSDPLDPARTRQMIDNGVGKFLPLANSNHLSFNL